MDIRTQKNPNFIESKFKRLIVIATHDTSWHYVKQITTDGNKCFISNYYFSENPLNETDKFHVTKFRGRLEDTLSILVLDFDAGLGMFVRKFFKKGIRKKPHVYKK